MYSCTTAGCEAAYVCDDTFEINRADPIVVCPEAGSWPVIMCNSVI